MDVILSASRENCCWRRLLLIFLSFSQESRSCGRGWSGRWSSARGRFQRTADHLNTTQKREHQPCSPKPPSLHPSPLASRETAHRVNHSAGQLVLARWELLLLRGTFIEWWETVPALLDLPQLKFQTLTGSGHLSLLLIIHHGSKSCLKPADKISNWPKQLFPSAWLYSRQKTSVKSKKRELSELTNQLAGINQLIEHAV